MTACIGRREFITLLGGAATWPLAARAQSERLRRVAVLMVQAPNDAEGQSRLAAFLQALRQLGWTEGQNFRIDTRWATANEHARRQSEELAALAPDVILATATLAVAPLQQVTRAIPIAFARGSKSMARNAIGLPSATESAARSAGSFPTARNTSTFHAASSR